VAKGSKSRMANGLLMILPNDKNLTLRYPLHTVDSPACLLRDTSTDVMTFAFTIFSAIIFASLCLAVSLSTPSFFLWILLNKVARVVSHKRELHAENIFRSGRIWKCGNQATAYLGMELRANGSSSKEGGFSVTPYLVICQFLVVSGESVCMFFPVVA